MSDNAEHCRSTVPRLPELWGGVECTMNRVNDSYHDQLSMSGHCYREADLDRFAALGIRVLRYPVLWERVAPDRPEEMDWTWVDRRLARLRELGMKPIAGLVHHGSGPHYTDLVSDSFVEGMARYARALAERHPWIEMYTPVNEPLTTARFSALYGHWYPHLRDDRSFVRALLNQCHATARCMQEIRRINPAARLVQTEDLGKVHSTPALEYQARFENERRWITFDLLTGRVTREHLLWKYLLDSGASPAELDRLHNEPCVPDILGLNHYVTSERLLDERIERYPAHTHGGNGRERYADVEAVRVLDTGCTGPCGLIMEAWNRYRLPMALTEVHLHSTREEQMRWFLELWTAACEAREQKADVRAVTAWALLGSFDWDKLVTRCTGCYEPGIFDLRSAEPRPTALAGMIRGLGRGNLPEHPVLSVPGWWRRPDRLIYSGRARRSAELTFARRYGAPSAAPGILIVGATGTLGRAFARICNHRGLPHVLLGRAQVDIADPDSVEAALNQFQPWAVINAAGFVRVDEAEQQRELCFRENVTGAVNLARICSGTSVRLVGFSSDLVFDGLKRTPYVESDSPAPLGVYGESKRRAETLMLESCPDALIIRTSAFFGPWDRYNFVTRALQILREDQPLPAADDVFISPTYIPDLVHATLDLLIDGECGCWHLANRGTVSWAELAQRIARLAGMNDKLVRACPITSLNLDARRPVYSALGSERGSIMPRLDDALPRYLREAESL